MTTMDLFTPYEPEEWAPAEPRIADYDIVLVSSSGGKDSQAMLDMVVARAKGAGALDRVVVAHADLGRVEWKGTVELAARQAEIYGVRFLKARRRQGDLLQHIEERGMFPDAKNRYCTSDHKRGQVRRIMTALVKEFGDLPRGKRVRVLHCMGMRAQESPARSKLVPFVHDLPASNGKREVDTWLPIFRWSTEEVWAAIRKSGVPHHPAYDLGMPRLSCCFCVLASKSALLIAGKHNPELLDAYVEVEKRIGHKFTRHLPIAQLRDEVRAGVTMAGPVDGWCM